MSKSTAFKRLAIGSKFSHAGENFRKATSRSAYRLKPNGAGETHATVPFSRSATCAVQK